MNEKQITCECGHENPYGTELCEACGKPLAEGADDQQKKPLLNMRYEGSARRSQIYNRSIIDKIWNFFSSVKVGVSIIIVTLIASSLGTIFPQEMYIPPNVLPEEHYKSEYGTAGQLYYLLGFHNLYGSWWYIILIAALGISIVIASIDRGVPLYRSLKNQRVTRHPRFMERQRLFSKSAPADPDLQMDKIRKAFEDKRYKVKEENGNLFAEKNRFSRWGAYVNHTGLIIFLLGAMLRFVPGMYVDEVLWLRDGETKAIPGTEGEYYLESKQFRMDVYNEGEEGGKFNEAINRVGGSVAKNYQTDAVLYRKSGEGIPGAEKDLEKVKSHPIRVNEPLKFDGFALYQVDFKLNELDKMMFKLEEKETGKTFGDIAVDLHDPKSEYDLGSGHRVEIVNYYPNFILNNGVPSTKTRIPDNPGFIFKMYTPDHPDGEISFVAIRTNIEPEGENDFKMSFDGIDTRNVAGLTVRKDNTLWFLGIGGLIFMIGVIQGMYWNYRRIWILRNDGEIWLAAHTNKNWYGIKRELDHMLEDTEINPPADQAEAESEIGGDSNGGAKQ
ncbi:cytochrome c biogenesis protein ResB [Bacillus marinisedimentorum]|uniref:cytochrome c biogenesis protein ResB n=1 Tax=Bacillus marinisedimentorum TaxID=1821260 RepID=UPI0007E125D6|nr:cytochrome c biogenesis protein ResB [Bacillus marinisedimentorum]